MRRVQTSTRGGSSLAGRLGFRPQQQQERGGVNQRGGNVDRRFGGRGGGRPTNTRERKLNIRHIVKITGYNPKTEIGAFRSFLEKRADVQFLEFNPNNNQIEAYLATKAEALSLNNLSGLFYGNRKLSMLYVVLGQNQPIPKPLPTQDQSLKADRKAIELFVTKHYDSEDRVLNLSNLSAFLPKVKSMDFNTKRFGLLIESVLVVSCPDVITLVLDRNNISQLAGVAYIIHNRLKIQNLSLDSNTISKFDELAQLKEANLRELVLSNNPVSTGVEETHYVMEVVRRLPDLFLLDLKPLKQVDNHPLTQLPPITGSFFADSELQNIAYGFLQKYYEEYDNDRNTLVNAYSENACFSLSHIPTSQPQGRNRASFRPDRFNSYSSIDRNLCVEKSTDERVSTLKTGPTHIVGSILDLPQTKHDLTSFTIDCFVVNIGADLLNIFVHGSFTETSAAKRKRSFSRVFVLVPTPANSTSHEGWPIVIVNDQLYIRHYTVKKSKPPQPEIPAPESASSVPSSPDSQEEKIKQLSELTKLKEHISKECLEKNQWHFHNAFADFNNLMAQGKISADMLQQ